ncbi:MAG: hypothetical protein JJ920_16310 [Roseitalea sp.]|nr:hypothetical protein [Roseitalea sp.]MBO6722702.1 hypothetical protein [Roseitalea sp.]MBO6744477.1 hypothetical protein [Roseitalea sp.]
MSTIITRLYASKDAAKSVASRLKQEEYRAGDVDVITKGGKGGLKTLKADISAAGVYPNAAATYAERVADGDVLLVVRAPIGQAVKARAIVDEVASIDAGVKYTEVYKGTGTSSARLARQRHLPPLLPNEAKIMTDDGLISSGTPFSSLFGIPLLTGGRTGKARLMTRRTTPFSSLLGLGLLARNSGRSQLMTQNTTPFSSMFGLPLLKERR